MFEAKIGLESEFFVIDGKDKVVLPPAYIPTDDFPLLGEVRADPGKTTAEVVTNLIKEKMQLTARLSDRYKMLVSPVEEVGLKVYREAMARCTVPKNEVATGSKNIYGTDITDFSDQIVKNGKIQGIRASCGLHIHFSCRYTDEVKVTRDKYEPVILPLKVPVGSDDVLKAITTSQIMLHRFTGIDTEKILKVSASLLNKPTVEYMVKKLDEAFFERFAPAKALRTKYRQPGFFELKDHGFEYRSLPASDEVFNALPEIVDFGFKLLEEVKTYVQK